MWGQTSRSVHPPGLQAWRYGVARRKPGLFLNVRRLGRWRLGEAAEEAAAAARAGWRGGLRIVGVRSCPLRAPLRDFVEHPADEVDDRGGRRVVGDVARQL